MGYLTWALDEYVQIMPSIILSFQNKQETRQKTETSPHTFGSIESSGWTIGKIMEGVYELWNWE